MAAHFFAPSAFRGPPWKELYILQAANSACTGPARTLFLCKTRCSCTTQFLCKTALCVKHGFDAKHGFCSNQGLSLNQSMCVNRVLEKAKYMVRVKGVRHNGSSIG